MQIKMSHHQPNWLKWMLKFECANFFFWDNTEYCCHWYEIITYSSFHALLQTYTNRSKFLSWDQLSHLFDFHQKHLLLVFKMSDKIIITSPPLKKNVGGIESVPAMCVDQFLTSRLVWGKLGSLMSDQTWIWQKLKQCTFKEEAQNFFFFFIKCLISVKHEIWVDDQTNKWM